MGADRPRHVEVYAVELDDRDGYATYRERMSPILARHGGAFGYDLEISEVLSAPGGEALDRVFTLTFPNVELRNRFFEDEDYRVVRSRYFEPSVRRLVRLDIDSGLRPAAFYDILDRGRCRCNAGELMSELHTPHCASRFASIR